MKKIYLFLILFYFIINSTYSQITPYQAEVIARKCLVLKSPTIELKNHFEKAAISSVHTEYDNNTILWYIFNFEPTGFVIVSADTLYHPIIAFSWRTNFKNEIPKNSAIEMLMNNQRNQMQKVSTKQIQFERVAQSWEKFLNNDFNSLKTQNPRVVAPLLHTQWNQDVFYNEFCPKDPAGPDGRTYAGCVATTLGQLMMYYRYPLSGTGSYTNQITTYGTHTVDFSQAQYNWSEMGTKLTRSNPEVAELLYHLGVSVDMHWGPNGSGMWNHKAAHTLRTFFGYVNETEYMFRDTVTGSWHQIIIDHIDRGEPLYYAGWTANQYVSGHAFVADGYQDTTFFHFNMGWGGAFDGYYNIDNLFVGSSDFSTMHEAVVNMFPATNYPYYCSGTKQLQSLDGTIDDGSGPLFNYSNNLNCSWLIAPFDTISSINLEFLNFELKPNDFLRIYRGQDANGVLVATYTSTNTPPANLLVNGNRVFINFTSNNSDNGKGFLISYRTNQVRTCSGLQTLTASSGIISDGSRIFNYQNQNTCRWRLEVPNAVLYSINFTEFELDSTDFVRIQNLNNGNIIATLTGAIIPEPIFVYADRVLITFNSTPTANSKGFALNYNTFFQNIDNVEIQNIVIYPNPANNEIYIHLSENNSFVSNVEIINLLGKSVLFVDNLTSQNKTKVDISNLKQGVYILRVRLDNGHTNISRFVKN